MEWGGVVNALLSSGPFGIICAVLLWRDMNRDKREDERERRREALQEKRTESDKAMAAALAMLAERIDHGKS